MNVSIRWRTGLAALLAATLLLTAGCQGYQQGTSRTAGEFMDDVAIQARVKMALLNDPDIKGLRINTEVRKGIVELHGRVGDGALKQRAIELVSAIKGVQRVDDRLTVVAE